ncbi:MAG: hypothetical protein WC360_05250 [Opitutales bacterium]|jgi:hypothetical protein
MKEPAHRIRQNAGIALGRERMEKLPARPEMIARGRKLLEDPDYPGLDVVRTLAGRLMPMLF